MPGGVCAVLDYEVDTMAEYVAEMATLVVTPNATATSAFRKFVSQILTSTGLPSTTILLGMNYLAKRINALKELGPCHATEGQVWRYLTVSLLLGSKFLDDNTFQNRSWSEVSGITVSELNSLEFDWLQVMTWRFYVNLDHSKDYHAWLDNWREWRELKDRQAAHASRERLASLLPAIDTDLARYHSCRHSPHSSYIQEQVLEYERYQALKAQQQAYHAREMAWAHNPWSAPLTPPDSGYGTPDYGLSAVSSNARYNDWFSQAAAQYSNCLPKHHHAATSHPAYHLARPDALALHHAYGNGLWEHAPAECRCPSCSTAFKPAAYFVPCAYGQTVMG